MQISKTYPAFLCKDFLTNEFAQEVSIGLVIL